MGSQVRTYTPEEEESLRQIADNGPLTVDELKRVIESEEMAARLLTTPVPYTTYSNGELPPQNRHERRAAAVRARKGH